MCKGHSAVLNCTLANDFEHGNPGAVYGGSHWILQSGKRKPMRVPTLCLLSHKHYVLGPPKQPMQPEFQSLSLAETVQGTIAAMHWHICATVPITPCLGAAAQLCCHRPPFQPSQRLHHLSQLAKAVREMSQLLRHRLRQVPQLLMHVMIYSWLIRRSQPTQANPGVSQAPEGQLQTPLWVAPAPHSQVECNSSGVPLPSTHLVSSYSSTYTTP